MLSKEDNSGLVPRRNPDIAAAVLLLLVCGGVIGNYLSPNSSNNAVAILQEQAPEYFEMEQYFQQEIDKRVGQLVSYEPNSPVIADLQQIDQAMQELKKELENISVSQFFTSSLSSRLYSSLVNKDPILSIVVESLEGHRINYKFYNNNSEILVYDSYQKEIVKVPIESISNINNFLSHFI